MREGVNPCRSVGTGPGLFVETLRVGGLVRRGSFVWGFDPVGTLCRCVEESIVPIHKRGGKIVTLSVAWGGLVVELWVKILIQKGMLW